MEITEGEIIKKFAKQYGHFNRNTLLPYEYEWTCISCGFNLVKRKHEHSKIRRKLLNFINRIKYAEQKVFCNCIDIHQIYEGNDYDKK